ncbi:MAG: hypothetical protein ACTSV0_05610 [Candidatus Freyarchaeota archaeon]
MSTGGGVALCLTILGFIVCLFIFWPLAFAILFLGLALFCALESSSKTPSRPPPQRRPRRHEPPIPPRRDERPPYWPRPYPEPKSITPSRYNVRIPVEERENEAEEAYVWKGEEELEPRVPGLYGTAETEEDLEELEEVSEEPEPGYGIASIEGESVEEGEEAERPPPEEEVTIPDERAERLRDLESEEEATRVILEELKNRWMSGKIDIEMYHKLKDKYEKKMEEVQKQKREFSEE